MKNTVAQANVKIGESFDKGKKVMILVSTKKHVNSFLNLEVMITHLLIHF